MGEYYSLRVKGRVKPEADRVWSTLDCDKDWTYAAHMAFSSEDRDVLLEYALLSRSNFIPFGALCDGSPDWSDGFHRNHSFGDVEFSCGIKDITVVEHFIRRVMPVLFAKVETCQSHFEYETVVRHWFFDETGCTGYEDRPDLLKVYGRR